MAVNLSALFALGFLFCAGLGDLIFKQYVARDWSIGAIWPLFFCIIGSLSGGLRFDYALAKTFLMEA